MVLESTVICLDNSEWMRNGDYVPSRIEAQQDAAGIICNTRTESHPENTVGLLAMAGKGVELLASPTEDIAKILACFSKVTLGGKTDFCNAVQIAQLSLKHRKNKNGGQRIIAFIGSPLIEDKKSLQKVGKQLKKNNVAIDIISMGEIDENQEKLLELVNATNSNDNSHLITVPPGVQPVDALMASPIMTEAGFAGMGTAGGMGAAAGGGGGGANNFAEYGGVDPSLDPELAMAIRVSTEEARAREEARTQTASQVSTESAPSAGDAASAGTAPVAASESPLPPLSQLHLNGEEEEDALLQRALELSMLSSLSVGGTATATSTATRESETPSDTAAVAPASTDAVQMTIDDTGKEDEDEDEAAMRLAMDLSMQAESQAQKQSETTTTGSGATATSAQSDNFLDPSFVSQLLGSVDVDTEDPLIKAALAQISAGDTGTGTSTSETEEKEKENKKRKEGPGGDKDEA